MSCAPNEMLRRIFAQGSQVVEGALARQQAASAEPEKTPLQKVVEDYEKAVSIEQGQMLAAVLRAVLFGMTCKHSQPALELLEQERDHLRRENKYLRLGLEGKEEQIIEFFLENYEPAPPCQRMGGKCLLSESTGLECASNEGPRNLDYLPCWKAFFKAKGGAQ